MGVIEGVTERKRAERIAHMAHHDPTDLPNRAAFVNIWQRRSLRREASDQFAVLHRPTTGLEVNDVFGHSVGDALLRSRSPTKKRLRGFLARLGGDEFTVIVAEGPQPSIAEALADRRARVWKAWNLRPALRSA